jgi:hypothetical protein
MNPASESALRSALSTEQLEQVDNFERIAADALSRKSDPRRTACRLINAIYSPSRASKLHLYAKAQAGAFVDVALTCLPTDHSCLFGHGRVEPREPLGGAIVYSDLAGGEDNVVAAEEAATTGSAAMAAVARAWAVRIKKSVIQ